ncbi:MAG: HAMP domain-containing sensor histidine kinase [Thermoleophilia bacterium]
MDRDTSRDRGAGDRLLLELVGAMGLGHGCVELVRDDRGRAVDHVLRDLDAATGRVGGIRREPARGRRVREVVPGIEDGWTERFDRIAAGGAAARFECEAARTGRWFEVHAKPIGRDRVAVVYSDITERRRAEVLLRDSEERQAFMLRLADALRPLGDPVEIQRVAARELGIHLGAARAFYVTAERDADGGYLHRIERDHVMRPATRSLAGHYPQGASGRPLLARLERGETLVCDDIAAVPGLGAAQRAACAAVQAAAFVAVPLVKGGAYVGGLCVVDAVPRAWTRTEVRTAEETAERTWAAVERSRAEAAAAAERDVREAREREFVANASHDLRTPLTGIVTALDALEAGAADRPEDRALFLAHIRRESDRMTRLCESLLLLTRSDTAAATPRRRVAVREVLEHVAADLEPRPGVRVEVDASPAATVVSNTGLLERVVANLAGNAAKYTPSGRIVLRAARDRGVVTIEVRDTGTGIRPEIAGRVFDRFFRGGDRSRDGFGLGLSIAARAAGALGGTLVLEPAPGGGTVARLTLPDDVR